MANGYMTPVPDPLTFDPTMAGGYASPAPVLGSLPGPMASMATPASMSSVLGAPPVDLASLEYARPGEFKPAPPPPPARVPLSAALAQFGIGAPPPPAPTGPVSPPPAPVAPTGATAPTGRAMATGGAAMGGVPDSYMGVDLTGAKKALAKAQGETALTATGRETQRYLGGEVAALRGEAARIGTEQEQAKKTLEQAQEAARITSAEEQRIAGDQAERMRLAEEDAAIERETRRQATEDAAQKLEAATKALDESKIDVDKAYGGAAGRIFAGLAVALGSFGASLTGGPNYAMQLVDQRINRELDAQRAEIDKKKGKVSQLGQLLQNNERLLGDATQARNLARAQTYKALLEDQQKRAEGRSLTPQQQQVMQQLEGRYAEELNKIQAGIRKGVSDVTMTAARERDARAAAGAAAARKRSEKVFESELKVQEALGIAAGKEAIESGGLAAPGQAAPKAVEKVLENIAKPAIGTKDLIGALRSLNQFEQGIMAYGSPEQAPGGSTYGLAQTLTPDLTEKARALTQTRTANILDYRRAQTGTAASADEEKRIMQAAGGNDPLANMRWIQQQRGKLLGELDTALKTVSPAQRDAVKQAILSQGGINTGMAAAQFTPMTKGR